jgi:hypothetical protein
MTAELIYRTSTPAAEAWWRNLVARRAEQDALRDAFEAEMLATYGPAQHRYGEGVGKRSLYTNGRVITGIDAGYNEQPPAGSGWRLDSKDRFWKPALRTAEGRKLKARLVTLTTYIWQSHVTEIGIPELIFTDRYLMRPSLTADDDPFVLFQTWGSGQCEKDCLAEQAKHPEIEWIEVKRSEWYAHEEAKAEATA